MAKERPYTKLETELQEWLSAKEEEGHSFRDIALALDSTKNLFVLQSSANFLVSAQKKRKRKQVKP